MSDHFGAVDYLVLVAMLLISTAIGLFFAWKDRKNTNEDEFLRGGQHMSTLPVCISILESFLPSTSFIGFPVVVYATGTQFWMVVVPAAISAVLACEVFLPIYYKMNLISVNQYLHKRFKSHNLQIIANISTLLSFIPFFGVEMLAPAIALSIVTDISITASIFIIGLIVTLYTSLGGLKGVIWTDFFQFSVMLFGLIAVIVRGSNISGGMAQVFKNAYKGGRLEFWNMDFDIYRINSFWIYLMGFTVLWMGTFSTSQMQVQRAVCMPTLKAAKRALYGAVPGFVFILSLTVLAGIVMYARYFDCDPILTGRVTRPDQLLPYFVMDIFEDDYKGLPGAFVACILGSSLSTLSSGLNAMSSIIWDDYAKKVLTFIPDGYNVVCTKLLAAFIGVISMSMAFAIKESQNIVEAAIMIYGASVGPMFAIFCLGLFFPWANKWGSGTALIIGQAFALWVTIGGVSDRRDPTTMMLGLSHEKCEERNITVVMPGAPLVAYLTDYKIPEYNPKGIDVIHHISPYFVPTLGFLIALLVGNVVSLATKGNKHHKIDRELVSLKICYYFEKLLPESWRQLQEEPLNRRRQSFDVINKTNGNKMDERSNRFNETTYGVENDDPEDEQQTSLPLRPIDKTTNI